MGGNSKLERKWRGKNTVFVSGLILRSYESVLSKIISRFQIFVQGLTVMLSISIENSRILGRSVRGDK